MRIIKLLFSLVIVSLIISGCGNCFSKGSNSNKFFFEDSNHRDENDRRNNFFEALPEAEKNIRGYYREDEKLFGARPSIVEIEPIGNGKAVIGYYVEAPMGEWCTDFDRRAMFGENGSTVGYIKNWEVISAKEIVVRNDVYYNKEGRKFERIEPDQCRGRHVSNVVSTDYYAIDGKDSPIVETCKIEYNNVDVNIVKASDGIFDVDFSYIIDGKRFASSDSVQLGHVLITDINSHDIDFWVFTDNEILHHFSEGETIYYAFNWLMDVRWGPFGDANYRIGISDHLIKGDDDDIVSGKAKGTDWAEAYAKYIRENSVSKEDGGIKVRYFPDSHSRYVFFAYIDDDNIPEMILEPNYYTHRIVSYKGGNVSELNGEKIYYYREKKNAMRTAGWIWEYLIFDVDYKQIISGGYSLDGWKINGEPVSMSDCVSTLQKTYDVTDEKCIVNENMYTCDSAISLLSNL